MTRYTFETLAEWVLPRLPKRFQEGRLPYIFLFCGCSLASCSSWPLSCHTPVVFQCP